MTLIPGHSLPAANRRLLLTGRPAGIPTAENFTLDESPLSALDPGSFRVRALYLSADPAQRGWASDVPNYMPPVAIGAVMRALGTGIVVDSKDPAHPVGSCVYGWLGWQDYAVLTAADVITRFATPGVPLEYYAGLLGISGLTARISLTRLGQLRERDTVLVSAAAGAVGSLVGQLARLAGARTIGLAGSEAKVRTLIERYGYATGINYRSHDLVGEIAAAAPEGLDLYFDNVGGPILDASLRHMRVGGRVIQCGTASIASWSPVPTGPRNEREILTRRLSWNGFVLFDHANSYMEAFQRLERAAIAGELSFENHILDGIEQAPEALAMLYRGANRGKMLIWTG